MRFGTGQPGELGDRSCVFATPVIGDTLLHPCPARLVCALPQAALRRGLRCGLLRTRRRQPQGANEDHGQRTATAEPRQYQQHHQRNQPVTIVLPQRSGLATRGACHVLLRIKDTQRAQVGRVQRDRCITSAAGSGQALQRIDIQLGGFERASVPIDTTARTAQSEHHHPVPLRMGTLRLGNRTGVGMVGDQQDGAMRKTGLVQQRQRPGDRTIDMVAIGWHHLG